MRTAATGLLLGLVLTVLFAGGITPWNSAHAQFNERAAPLAGGALQGLTWNTPNGQQLAVLDEKLRVLSVYEINSSGTITLRSVRNIGWDLQMEEFNSTNPSPREIRAMIERR